MRVHVVADQSQRDGGYVADRLAERGAQFVWWDRDSAIDAAQVQAADLLLLLGAVRSAHEDVVASRREEMVIRGALSAGVPVMGLCYGSQVAARALGGTSYRSDDVEVGWKRVDTFDDDLCPRGPWAQFHQNVFVPAATSLVLGSSWVGPQCFIDTAHGAPVIAWQFHPEVSAATFTQWVNTSRQLVVRSGQQGSDLIAQAKTLEGRSRRRAHTLVDRALEFLKIT